MDLRRRDEWFVKALLGISLAATSLLALVILWQRTGGSRWALVAGGAALALPVLGWLTTRLARLSMPYRWVLLLAILNMLVIVPELSLRVTGFRYQSGIEFGYPRPDTFITLAPDKDLFWVYPEGQAGINSYGFQDDEPITPKPARVRRIVFLGDSCTEPGFHQFVEASLNQQGDEQVDCVMLAAAGYSSHQGRVLAEKYLEQLEPDLVVAWFGWNDHWQAYGSTDAQKKIDPASSGSNSLLASAYNNCRLWQGARYLISQLFSSTGNMPTDKMRVPPSDYRQNMATIGKLCRTQGVPLVLITGPSSHEKSGVPDYLVERHFVPDKPSAIRRHQEYAQLTRDVATEGAHELLDLASTLVVLDKSTPLFMQDGIHFEPAGLVVVTEQLVALIRDKKLLEEKQVAPPAEAPAELEPLQ